MEAQQCVKLTSTNRPFGLIIKLSQTVFEKACSKVLQPPKLDCTPLFPKYVRPRVELVSPALKTSAVPPDGRRAEICCRSRDRRPLTPVCVVRESPIFLVVISRGSHPFPSRTRKLSLAEPMILHGQLCGNVGRRRD